MEYNFFDPIRKAPQKTNIVRLIIMVCLIVVMAGQVGLLAIEGIKYVSYKSDIGRLEKQLADETYLAAVSAIDVSSKELDLITSSMEPVEKFQGLAQEQYLVKEELLNTIAQQLPVDMYLKAVTAKEASIAIEGVTHKLINIAYFENNLRTCGMFVGPIVSKIDEIEKATASAPAVYSFNLTLAAPYIPPVEEIIIDEEGTENEEEAGQ